MNIDFKKFFDDAKKSGNIKVLFNKNALNFKRQKFAFQVWSNGDDGLVYTLILSLDAAYVFYNKNSDRGWLLCLARDDKPVLANENFTGKLIEISEDFKKQVCDSNEFIEWLKFELNERWVSGTFSLDDERKKSYIDMLVANFINKVNIKVNNDKVKSISSKNASDASKSKLKAIADEIGKGQEWSWSSSYLDTNYDPFNGAGDTDLWGVFIGTYMRKKNEFNMDAEKALRKLATIKVGDGINYIDEGSRKVGYYYTREK